MSHRRSVALAAAVLFALPAGQAAAATTTTTLAYTCSAPTLGTFALSATAKTQIQDVWAVGEPTPPITVSADLSSLLGADKIPGAAKISGNTTFSTVVRTAQGVDVTATATGYTPNVPVTAPGATPLTLTTTAKTGSLTFDDPGIATVSLGKIAMKLVAIDSEGTPITVAGNDTDGQPDTIDIECSLDPATQPAQVGTIEIANVDRLLRGSAPVTCAFYPVPGIRKNAGTLAFSSSFLPVYRAGEPFALSGYAAVTFPNMPSVKDGFGVVEGKLIASLSLVPKAGGAAVPVTGEFAVDKTGFRAQNLVLQGAGGLTGNAPAVPGDYTLRLDGARYALIGSQDGWGGGPTPFDVACDVGTDGASTDLGVVKVAEAVDTTPATPTPTPTTPATPTPTPTGEEPTAQFGYALTGSTTLNTLTKGTMPLTGSVDASLTLSTGNFVADLRLNPTQGRLTALGFLPVTATVGFVTSGPTTGKLVDDQLSTNTKVRIKVTSVKAFGAIPLAGGNNCQTKQLSDVALKSTDSFDPTTKGGTIGGTYKISDLNGCGPLNGLVSPITAGRGNTISLKLTPKP